MATYYVKTGGNDSLDGLSEANAWVTITKANTAAIGDTILFKNGDTFVGTVLTKNNQTWATWVSGGPYAIIDGNSAGVPMNTSTRSGVTLRDLHIKNSNAENLRNNGGTNLLVEHCILDTTPSYGIRSYGTTPSVTLRNCTITGSTFSGAQIETGTATLDRVTATVNAGNGIQVIGTAVVTTTSCISELSSAGNGYLIDGLATVTNYYSVARQNHVDGFNSNTTCTLTNYWCESYENGASGAGNGDGYTAHDASTHNLIYCLGWGNWKSGAAMTGTSSGVIYGCTFYNNYEGSLADDYGIWINSTTGTWLIKNNITKHHRSEIYISAAAVTGGVSVTSDYNCFDDSRGGSAFHYNGTDYNFADYQTASSQDANSINSDPMFVDAATDNFYLRVDSPCIGAGTDLGATYLYGLYKTSAWPDSVLTASQGSVWDIGAYVSTDNSYRGNVAIIDTVGFDVDIALQMFGLSDAPIIIKDVKFSTPTAADKAVLKDKNGNIVVELLCTTTNKDVSVSFSEEALRCQGLQMLAADNTQTTGKLLITFA